MSLKKAINDPVLQALGGPAAFPVGRRPGEKPSGRKNSMILVRGNKRQSGGMFRAPPTLFMGSTEFRVSGKGERYSTDGGPPLLDEQAMASILLDALLDSDSSDFEKDIDDDDEDMFNFGLNNTINGQEPQRRSISSVGALLDRGRASILYQLNEEEEHGGKGLEDDGQLPGHCQKPRESIKVSFAQVVDNSKKEVKWSQRKRKGGSFVRRRHSLAEVGGRKSEIVMSTPAAEEEPWEAYLEPGSYFLSNIVSFPDVDRPVPRHAKFWVPKNDWKSALERNGSGTIEIDYQELRREIPVETATEILLTFYDCHLISERTIGDVVLKDEHIIQDFLYSKDYFKKYVTGVGAGVECHDFSHMDCPLSPLDESGFFLLGKWVDDGEDTFLCMTMFRIPQLHALFIPAGTIHSNDYLRGTWRTMLSWTANEPIDHVTLMSVQADGSKKKDYFRIKGVDLFG